MTAWKLVKDPLTPLTCVLLNFGFGVVLIRSCSTSNATMATETSKCHAKISVTVVESLKREYVEQSLMSCYDSFPNDR
jgi:hypothetical protein